MALPIAITKTLSVAADDDGICTSQTPGAAGDMTINGALASGGVASLTSQRRVLFTFAADETGHTFTIDGTQLGGATIRDTLAGTTAGTAYTSLDFLTVTRVAISAAATGAIKVGTNGVGSTQWLMPNDHITPFAIGFGVEVTGTVNYTVQHTFENPLEQVASNFPPSDAIIPVAFNHAVVASQTTNADGNYAFPCRGIRCTINSGTGTIKFTSIQAGIRV